jgi:hypothetical protein
MPEPENRYEDQETMRRLAGCIARMPDADPPPGLTDAVMRRIQPKKLSWSAKWLRHFQNPRVVLPSRVVPVGLAAALILCAVAFIKGYDNGRKPLISRRASSESGPKMVTFVLDWPSARSVSVIGSFNHWDPDGYQMHRDMPGAPWKLILKLQQGKYAYAFLIDGQRMVPDPLSLWHQKDGFGNQNSALIVENGRHNANKF